MPQNSYDIKSDPRMKSKIAHISIGKQVIVDACKGCPYYYNNELKNQEYCYLAVRDINLPIGQLFPIWCPLETVENATA